METVFKEALGDIVGGSVLDVATHEGGFVQILLKNLKSYTEILGIDTNGHAIEIAQSAFAQENIQFMQMDAEQLSFEDERFDTISISASLHHVANIPQVLAEMKRVLKPGGYFIIAEMHSDGQTEAQLTSVYLHHWVADVDSALGILHNHTLPRQEFVDYMAELGLCDVVFYDFSDTESDPRAEKTITDLGGLIERNIQRMEGMPSCTVLKQRGQELHYRLDDVGVQREPVLVAVGKK